MPRTKPTVINKPEPKAKPTLPPAVLKPLSEEQVFLTQMASDVITHGSGATSTKLFIEAMLRHEYWRRFPSSGDNQAERVALPDCVKGHYEDLQRVWIQDEPQKAEPDGTTIQEVIRVRFRERLRRQFEDFMREAELADIHLLLDIFVDFESERNGLGAAFAYVLDGSKNFVKVTWKHKDRVRAFAEALEAGKEDPIGTAIMSTL